MKKMKIAAPSILYTFRVGTYRAILSIEDDKLLILVLEVDHRRTAYRK
ncbi:type II toxin-antitoxin system RelE family toxin [Methanoculleus frigidifontis]